MSTTSPRQPAAAMPVAAASTSAEDARGWIGWSSLLFAVLQSVCTFFAATAGLRLLIGVGSLALSAEATALLARLHANWIRIPMVSLALAGALLNLAVILHMRRLRSRPASQWRQTAVPPNRLRMERLQLLLSVATLVLITLEECFHLKFSHSL